MKLNSYFSILLVFIISPICAQYNIPDGYYIFPIRPGETNYLSGTMGELRPAHFHGGIDIKTSGTEGLNVYAVADGYISRVKVVERGFGNAVYVKHPNGTTSVYAHLSSFSENLNAYVLKNQYKNQSFTVDLYPSPGEFRVKQGEVIAYSGNSGSSFGPHLHFELRDKNHDVIDPAKMRFKELVDNLPPRIRSIAFVTKSSDAAINGQIGRFEFDVVNVGGNYILKEPVHLSGPIGIELYAEDRMNGTRNRYGIPDVEMHIDGEVRFKQELRKFSFRTTRDIMIHTNYQSAYYTRRRFNKLYIDDGNRLDFYLVKKGVFNYSDTTAHQIFIKLTDAFGNSTTFKTQVNKKPIRHQRVDYNSWYVNENIMAVTALDNNAIPEIYANNLKYSLQAKTREQNYVGFFWDLRNGLVDSIDFCNEVIKTNYIHTIYPNQESNFFNHTINAFFPKTALYDTMYLKYHYNYDTINDRELFTFQNGSDPVKKNIYLTLKPNKRYNTEYARVYRVNGSGRQSFVGGDWHRGQLSFKTRELTNFTIAYDSIPPTVKPQIIFQITSWYSLSTMMNQE